MMIHSHNHPYNQLPAKKTLIELPFHNILSKNSIIKPFTDRKLLTELPLCKCFLEEPNIINVLVLLLNMEAVMQSKS